MDNDESMKISYELLKSITDNFSEELLVGSGAYGRVYKGIHANGKEIAVKVLRDIAALDDMEFKNELQNLAKLGHPNIVQLVGYCNESEEHVVYHNGGQVIAEKLHMALCFEYVDNGILDRYISDENQGFQWHIRYKIIKGICEGLKYLHTGLETPVLHLDLKPANILLDKELIPKIADFGLSRLVGNERPRNTMNKSTGIGGYLSPEYLKSRLLSPAFDIFTLGITIAKIMVGEERYHEIADMPPQKLVKLVHNNWKKRLQEIVRPRWLDAYCQQVMACIEVASKCLTEDPLGRPNILEIVNKLNGTEITSIPPEIKEFHDSTTNLRSVRASEITDGQASHAEKRSNFLLVALRNLSFELLENITDGFSNDRLIGKGTFGRVYKGVYDDGQVIAVKILRDKAPLDYLQFHRVIKNLVSVQHENIVRLVGFCNETEEVILEHDGRMVIAENTNLALCTEYVQNGSLQRYISDTDETRGLDWCTRYKILKGICDGLRHLHEGLPTPILHLDLKPENILLDENMVPRIGDFALSTLLGEGRTLTPTSFVGIRGYLPPEFFKYQIISKESDIFSLGVIFIKLLTGMKSYPSTGDMTRGEFLDLVLGKSRKSIEATMKDQPVDGYYEQVKKCIEIALSCVETERHKRPNIGDIVLALNETETLICEKNATKE